MEEKVIKNPVVFFDLETTGKDKDTNKIRIVQISAHKYADTENWVEIGTLKYMCNPGDVEIESGAIEVHGITPEMVKNCPTFQEIAPEVYKFFEGCDVGGYNNNFYDNSVLYFSFLRAGFKWDYRKIKSYDILSLYRKYHSSKLSYVYKRFTGKDLEDAHDADADILGTVAVYKAMKERCEDFEEDELLPYKDRLDMIGDFKVRINDKGEKEPYYGFSDWKGKSVEEVGVGMLDWMIDKNPHKFPADTIHVAKKLKDWLIKKNKAKSNWKEEYDKIKKI